MHRLKFILQQYWHVLAGVRRLAGLTIFVSSISGCAEALGIVGMAPVLNDKDQSLSHLWPSLLAILAFLLVATILKFASERLIAKVTVEVERRSRRDLSAAVVQAKWIHVAGVSQGDITAGIMNDATMLSNGAYAFMQAVTSLAVVIVLSATAAFLTPIMLLASSMFVIAIGLILRSRLKHVRENEVSLARSTAEISERISSSMRDLKYLRLSASDRRWLSETGRTADRLSSLRFHQLALPVGTRTIVDSVGAFFLVALIALGLIVLHDSALSVIFVAVFYRLAPRLQALQQSVSTVVGVATWIESWRARLDRLGWNGEDPLVGAQTSKHDWKAPPAISFENVSFSYDGQSAVLVDVSFEVPSGERLAIIGGSGAGKSTALDLMLGLFAPTSGRVLLDGQEQSEAEWASFRKRVGVVPQDVPLLTGTIAENVCWGDSLDPARLARAIEMASLGEYVAALERGLETTVTASALGLSGGQRQRIGIARALYRDPLVLVMDEATSALDQDTEETILKTLDGLPRSITIISVSHKPAVLDHVDKVLRLSYGSATVPK